MLANLKINDTLEFELSVETRPILHKVTTHPIRKHMGSNLRQTHGNVCWAIKIPFRLRCFHSTAWNCYNMQMLGEKRIFIDDKRMCLCNMFLECSWQDFNCQIYKCCEHKLFEFWKGRFGSQTIPAFSEMPTKLCLYKCYNFVPELWLLIINGVVLWLNLALFKYEIT